MEPSTITLDVREDIREGREPFRRIMDAVGHLRDGDTFRLIAPFEPRPLINMLSAQGFTAVVTRRADDDFEIVFSSAAATEAEDLL
jgi:uncharacterized protein (DUF2249 family)